MIEHPRIAVLLSGAGSTLNNLLEYQRRGELAGRVVHVISSREDAKGLDIARTAGLTAAVISRRHFANVESFSQATFANIRNFGGELVCLAGYLALLRIPEDFRGRVLNVHPSLLPRFGGQGMYGRHVHDAVVAAGETESGCTIHDVDDQYDHGTVLLQRTCPVSPDDTPEDVARKVGIEERIAYPAGIRLWAERNGFIS
jgi:phosphoribosylglycinamide formyltransferase 1